MQTFPKFVVFAALVTMAGPVVLRAQTPAPISTPVPGFLPSPAPSPSAVHKPVLPMLPIELLGLLPKTPDKWQIKQSRANNFIIDWVSSQATREFNYQPPVAATANPGDAPPPPLILRITITDTGYYQGLMGDFQGSPSSKPDGAEHLTLDGFPARLIPLGKMGERLRVLVKNRYVIQIDVQNQPANSVQVWWKTFDVPKLAALPIDGEEKLPRPFPVTRIDELDPRNNSVSKVSWATQEEADATSKRRR